MFQFAWKGSNPREIRLSIFEFTTADFLFRNGPLPRRVRVAGHPVDCFCCVSSCSVAILFRCLVCAEEVDRCGNLLGRNLG